GKRYRSIVKYSFGRSFMLPPGLVAQSKMHLLPLFFYSSELNTFEITSSDNLASIRQKSSVPAQ
ncbi:hypothetical protein, partial [Victivallis lenta]|uniref:hypothetical protein n=1 Tax=Victivallis lenta TaxID=2606640 RepID=UPI003AB8A2B3